MSSAKRAYDILRGYVTTEWERIKGVEEEYAEAELNEALGGPQATQTAPRNPLSTPGVDSQTRARQILGVTATDDFTAIRAAFERLNKRSDPANFPPNSNEARQASEIQKRVNWAYTQLTENIDTTEKRFKSLEIQ